MSQEQDQVLQDGKEKTRRAAAEIQGDVVRRLAYVTQGRVGAAIGVHPSTVSRIVSEDLEKVALLLAALDLKVVPADSVVTTQTEMRYYKIGAVKLLQADLARDEIYFSRKAAEEGEEEGL